MQSTHFSDDLMPRSQIEVIGVVQHETKAKLLQVYGIDPLHGPQCSDWHESWGVDLAMGRAESPHSCRCLTILLLN
jgi:hypothetical protein